MKKLKLGLPKFLIVLLLSGCASSHRPSTPTSGNVQRLIDRPDAIKARAAAPEWCRDALMTVNSLEYQIQILEIKSHGE